MIYIICERCTSYAFSSLSIVANRQGNTVLFHHEGGVDVGDVDAKATKMQVDIESTLSEQQARELVKQVSADKVWPEGREEREGGQGREGREGMYECIVCSLQCISLHMDHASGPR